MKPLTHLRNSMCLIVAVACIAGCGEDFAISGQTAGLVRLVRPGVQIEFEGSKMAILEDTRLIRGTVVQADETGRAVVELDNGARIVVDASSEVTVVSMDTIGLIKGRLWVDAGEGEQVVITLPDGGKLRASEASTSIVLEGGKLETYGAAGELTYDLPGGSGLAREGEILTASGKEATVSPAELWTDWTGGLAEAGPQPSDTPTGIGEIFARKPGSIGVTRMPLVIRRHDVRVTVRGDLAVTETVQEFFNPASETLEGIYKLHIPEDAVLQRFAVDRNGKLVDGYIKEKEKARADYESYVYQGSTHDPALLEWIAPGRFKARIYPIAPGAVRVVAYRYVQWLRPSGQDGDKRTYMLPMGSSGVAPLIGEFSIIADLDEVGTSIVQAGLGARVEEGKVVFSASDFRPKSDFWLELLEVAPDLDGKDVRMVTHTYDAEQGLLNETDEEIYFYTQFLLRPEKADLDANRDLRVAVVSDLSAATDDGLADLGVTFVDSLLRQLDDEDSIAVLAGDLEAAMMGGESVGPVKATAGAKEQAIDALSRRATGGATDIGTLITQAAEMVGGEPGGVVVYVGDGFPTVGEMDLAGLLERISKLPHAVRLYGVALGDESNADLLAGLCEGSGKSMRVANRIEAAETAYRILADASIPVFTEVTYEIEGEVERLYPRSAITLRANEPLAIIGRITGEDDPETIRVEAKLGGKPVKAKMTLHVEQIDDHSDLRLRWATRRLEALTRASSGREALVELGTRYQIITPYTSFYVPPAVEAESLPPRPYFEIFVMPGDQGQQEEPGFVKRVLFGAVGLGFSMMPFGCALRDSGEQAPMEEQQVAEQWSVMDEAEEGGEEYDRESNQHYTTSTEMEKTENRPAPAPSMDKKDIGGLGMKGSGEGGGGSTDGTYGLGGPGGSSGKSKGAPKKSKKSLADDTARKARLESAIEETGILSALGSLGGDGDDWAAIDSLKAGGYYAPPASSAYLTDEQAQAMTTSEEPESLQGGLDAWTIKKITGDNAGAVRACYEDQLAIYPDLEGRVKVKVVVGSSGSVLDADVMTTTLGSGAAESCILAEVRSWNFPVGEAASTSVAVVPFNFQQGSDVKAEIRSFDNFGAAGNELNLQLQMSQQLLVQQNEVALVNNNANFMQLKARKSICTAEANKPLADRVEVWSERLGISPSVGKVVSQFNQARRNCEIKTSQHRRAFARLALNKLATPGKQCQFMNRMKAYPKLVDYIRKKILATVSTPGELSVVREVCDDATLASDEEIDKILDSKKIHDDKIKSIKKLMKVYPTDMDLKLVLLDLLEDAPGDKREGEAKRLAEDLRHHPYADDRVRTRVGEFYIRIEKPDEAKRCFSEIVEFSPFSPPARRRLGDLYRTYGWYEDAYRQYETLSIMVPSDETVFILMAEAAAQAGRVDEAVRLAERVSQSASAGGPLTPGDVARLFNGLRLAQMRIEAQQKGDEKKLKDLNKRSRRSGVLRDVDGLKVVLKWDHPDVHLDLLIKDYGSEIRQADSIAEQFGVEWLMRDSDRPGDIVIEVARTDASVLKESRAILYVILDEGEKTESIVAIEVEISDKKKPKLAYLITPEGKVSETEVTEEKVIGAKEVSK